MFSMGRGFVPSAETKMGPDTSLFKDVTGAKEAVTVTQRLSANNPEGGIDTLTIGRQKL
jgi:hypothetical protein